MSCNTNQAEVCYILGVNDALVWEIPDATVDVLGYNFKLGDYTFTATSANGAAVQDGENVIVTIPILAADFDTVTELNGSIVSNTKEAGSYHQLSVLAKFQDAV